MASVRLGVLARNGQLNAIRDLIDAGTGAGKLNIYDGKQPDDADLSVAYNRLLAVLRFSLISAPDASGGVLTFSKIEETIATGSGKASFARITDSNDIAVLDLDVGTQDTSIILNTTTITTGHPVRIVSGRLIAPA